MTSLYHEFICSLLAEEEAEEAPAEHARSAATEARDAQTTLMMRRRTTHDNLKVHNAFIGSSTLRITLYPTGTNEAAAIVTVAYRDITSVSIDGRNASAPVMAIKYSACTQHTQISGSGSGKLNILALEAPKAQFGLVSLYEALLQKWNEFLRNSMRSNFSMGDGASTAPPASSTSSSSSNRIPLYHSIVKPRAEDITASTTTQFPVRRDDVSSSNDDVFAFLRRGTVSGRSEQRESSEKEEDVAATTTSADPERRHASLSTIVGNDEFSIRLIDRTTFDSAPESPPLHVSPSQQGLTLRCVRCGSEILMTERDEHEQVCTQR